MRGCNEWTEWEECLLQHCIATKRLHVVYKQLLCFKMNAADSLHSFAQHDGYISASSNFQNEMLCNSWLHSLFAVEFIETHSMESPWSICQTYTHIHTSETMNYTHCSNIQQRNSKGYKALEANNHPRHGWLMYGQTRLLSLSWLRWVECVLGHNFWGAFTVIFLDVYQYLYIITD